MKKMFFVNSLEKVFPDEQPGGKLERFSLLKGERYSFQLAVFCESGQTAVRISPPAELADALRLYTVGLIPVHVPAKEKCEDDFLLKCGEVGEYPDVLTPCGLDVTLTGGGWRSVWMEWSVPEDFPAGERELTFAVELPSGQTRLTLTAQVINAVLPPQELVCTHWFHCDCLADQYGVPVFSEEHWRIIENYMRFAVQHGINFLLTPLFTPPLDTQVGGERPTVQLVDVRLENYEYRFGFDRLERWMDTANRCGVRYFEMSHLFTQWGAHHAPKIMAQTPEGERQIFGWDTRADGAEYRHFLKMFAAALDEFLKKKQVQDRCYFHVSDEPSMRDYFSYKKASEIVSELFGSYKRFDSLSDYQFFAKGLTKLPVPVLSSVEQFAGRVPEQWCYYCGGPAKENYVNRFLYYPSVRNRALGMGLFRYDCKGFLHWGYNFWYTVLSTARIDPFRDTASGGGFPAGDGFVVYPGTGGEPLPSLRLKVFYEALQDERALRLLTALAGREQAMETLNQAFPGYSFRSYPQDSSAFLALRQKINSVISSYCS